MLFQRTVYFFIQVERIEACTATIMTELVCSVLKTLCLGGKKAADLREEMHWANGACPRWQRGLLYPEDPFSDDPTEMCAMCHKDWEFLLCLRPVFKPTCFLKITILWYYFCVPHVSSEAEGNETRGMHRVSFCLGTMVLGFWNIWASGTTEPPSVSTVWTSIFQNKAANLEGLGHGKRKVCSGSSGSWFSEGREDGR